MQLSRRILPWMAGCAAIFSEFTAGADPAWWSDPATTIFDGPWQNTSNWSPANVGQLKNVATQANAYLDARLSLGGGSGAAVDVVCQFTNGGNYQPLNVGQLKTVAKAFYDRLAQIHFDWGTGNPGVHAPVYPWGTGTTDPGNAAPVNLGQLKNLFSFEIGSAFLSANTDADGLSDWWEYSNFGNLTTATSNTDQDGDGLSNGQEQVAGTNPLATDTDADGLRDSNETTLGKNPLIPDHPDVALVIRQWAK